MSDHDRLEHARLARIPWPIASLASSGMGLFNAAFAFSCSRKAAWAPEDAGKLRPRIGKVHLDDADRLGPIFGGSAKSGSAKKRRGGSPDSSLSKGC